MRRFRKAGLPLAWAFLAALTIGCGGTSEAPSEEAGKPAADATTYPAPRFPAYLKQPTSIDEVMPAARSFVRGKALRGGLGVGAVNEGETVLVVPDVGAEEMILEAIKAAAAERKVTVLYKYDYEMVGLTQEQALAYQKVRQTFTAEAGYMEASNWIESQFKDPAQTKAWLKERRPDLYDLLYPKSRDLSPEFQVMYEKMKRDSVGAAIRAFLEKNPTLRGVYWGKGGGPGAMRALYPLHTKYLGFFTADNRWEMMSALPTYPSDVWLLSEEKSMEPLAYIDRIDIDDPEGTKMTADVTEEMAARWARGAYQRGHLYLFPNQASGRFGYSVIDYPALQGEWIPREPMTLMNGVIAATNGHGGFFPRMEVHYKDGYISEVKGGGPYGDTLREFQNYPNIKDLTYPHHNRKGYWWLYEIASGTNPKWFRNPTDMVEGTLTPERNRSGVIHWGQGLRLWHDPEAPVESPSWIKFTDEHNLPKDHGFHMHSYFLTYRAHLRNADRTIMIQDKGHLTSLDDPEVRALTSRYGNVEAILAEDWIPEVPGINAPGDYMKDYAPNPWKVSKAVIDKAVDGSYQHYFPAPGATGTQH